MARKVLAACGGSVRGKVIALLGLTFKPNTDDMRDSPSIAIVTALQDAGAKLNVFDPEGMEQAKLYLENLNYCSDPYACCEAASALVIITEWDAFRALDLDHPRPGIGQLATAIGCGDGLFEGDDEETGKGELGHATWCHEHGEASSVSGARAGRAGRTGRRS